jgi:hypothetical protein
MKINTNSGFTFVEIILYIALISIVFGSLNSIGLITVREQQKSSVISEVGASGRFVSERIKREIRGAKGINSVTSSSISLQSFDASRDPTVIDMSAGVVRIKLGSGSTIALHPTNLVVNDLTFTNVTSSDAKSKNIKYSFTIQSATNSSQIYTNSMVIEGDAEIRSN